MIKITMADIEKVYRTMHGHDISPLPTGMHLAVVESKDVVPPELFIADPYLPDQGDYQHVGDIAKYHIFVPK